jgi:hypothetical protein
VQPHSVVLTQQALQETIDSGKLCGQGGVAGDVAMFYP